MISAGAPRVEWRWQNLHGNRLRVRLAEGKLILMVHKNKAGAWGLVVRDEEGRMVLAGASNVSPVQTDLMAEAMACVKTVEAVQCHGISRIHVETDSSKLCSPMSETWSRVGYCSCTFVISSMIGLIYAYIF